MSLLFNGRFAMRTTGLWFAALLPLLVFVFACAPSTDKDNDDEANSGVKITGVSVKPSPGSVSRGGFTDFKAAVSGLDFTDSPDGAGLSERDQQVTWSVDGAVAATTGINSEGRLVVSAAETSEKLTVKAESKADRTKSGIVEVAVGPDVATVSSVTISPLSALVALGGFQSFIATVTGLNYPDPRVDWTIDEKFPDISTKTVITSSGLLVVAQDETSDKLTVRATSVLNKEVYNTATVKVNSVYATVESVTVTPAEIEVERGRTAAFTAAVTGKNNPDTGVTWSILETGRNSGTDITASGKLIVAAEETLNTLTVRATSVINTNRYGTAVVTLTSNAAPVTVTKVTISPVMAGVYPGGTASFSATVEGTGNPSQAVVWTVSGAVKAGTYISADGTLTVDAGESPGGSLTVKATAVADSSQYATAPVTVLSSIIAE